MSIHNIYPEFDDRIVARWKKAVTGGVAGMRLNPYEPDKRISFLLVSQESNFDIATKRLTFCYDDDVIELYSEREAKLFATINRNAIERGLLTIYEGANSSVDTSNAVSDGELQRIIALKNRLAFRNALKKITADSTLVRINSLLTPEHKQWYLDEIAKRKSELN